MHMRPFMDGLVMRAFIRVVNFLVIWCQNTLMK